MRVKTKIRFMDLTENTMREVGDEFNVTDARLKEIERAGAYVEVIDDAQPTKPGTKQTRSGTAKKS